MSGTAPPDPNAPVMLRQFDGLRNTIERERLGAGDLEVGQNIDLDDAKQARRRRGYTSVDAANHHSLFQGPGYVLGVRNDVLGVIQPNYTFTALRSGVGSDPLAYVSVANKVYFSSALTSGVIDENLTVGEWGQVDSSRTWLSPVVNPTSTLGAIRGQVLGAPPMATALASYNGRIYLGQGRTLWATELYLYTLVDKTRRFFQFEADITALGAVDDGVYVGTEAAAYFLAGNRFDEMRLTQVADVGVARGSMVAVSMDLVEPIQQHQPMTESKLAVMFLTQSGLCVGLEKGSVYNLTQDRVLFPPAERVAAIFRRQDGVNQYIGVVDSGGTPANTARIGDYVDAEIRRYTGA
jgi:hypothetical protein